MMEALRILVAGRIGTDINDLAVGTTTVTWDQAGSISFEPAPSPPPRPPPKHLEDPRPKDTESVGGEERATSPPKTAEPVDARDMAPPPSKPLPLEEQLANQDVGTSPPQTLSKEGADGPMDVVAPNGPEDRPQGNEGAGAGPQAEEPVKGPTEPTEEARTDTAEGGPTAGEGVQATEQPKQTEAPPAPPAADLGMVMDLDGPSSPADVDAQGEDEGAEPAKPANEHAEATDADEDQDDGAEPTRKPSPLTFGDIANTNSEHYNECKLFLKFPQYITSITSVFRVHWLRARAQRGRWAEELVLVKNEMKWTVNFYMYMAETWQQRRDTFGATPSTDRITRGSRAFAERQLSIWNNLGEVSERAFRNVDADFESDRVAIM